jgi:shikimate kinase
MQEDLNIVLTGMPGSGKSTIGVLVAKITGRSFVDTDVVIQAEQGKTLQAIIDEKGYLGMREVEEQMLLRLACRDHVIATGGSAVYSAQAMGYLKQHGSVVFLDLPFELIERRVNDLEQRGIARRPGQSLRELFDERYPLYKQYADYHVLCDERSQHDIAHEIAARFNASPS